MCYQFLMKYFLVPSSLSMPYPDGNTGWEYALV